MSGPQPFVNRPFELLREIVPSSPLTSHIIFRADKAHGPVDAEHIDRIELGMYGGKRFPINKERFDH